MSDLDPAGLEAAMAKVKGLSFTDGPDHQRKRDVVGRIICAYLTAQSSDEGIASERHQHDRLRSFAQWLVAMDEPDSVDRRTVTLSQIIEEAEIALSTAPVPDFTTTEKPREDERTLGLLVRLPEAETRALLTAIEELREPAAATRELQAAYARLRGHLAAIMGSTEKRASDA